MEGQHCEQGGYAEKETIPQTGGSRASDLSATYAQQGFLSGLPVLDAFELQAAREAFGNLEREFGEEYTQYNLHNVHQEYDWVMALAKHPKVLQLVSVILGPDVILLDSRFICKYPVGTTSSGLVETDVTTSAKQNSSLDNEEGDHEKVHIGHQDKPPLPFVAWYQDMRYWGLAGGPVLSVWLALDDSLEDNGALKVIPGSHSSGLLPHQPSCRLGNMLSVNQEIPEELVKTDAAVVCPLLAGEMSVHDGLLIHGSVPNTSGRRRCGFVMRFAPTCVYPIQDPDRPRSFNATMLVCGTDKFRNFRVQSSGIQQYTRRQNCRRLCSLPSCA